MKTVPFDPQPCDRFTPAYRDLVQSIVSEPAPPTVRPGVRERLLRCLWFDQEFDDVLRTEADEKVTVLSPGWWNLESGPDFKHAAIRLAGRAVKGDVETHVHASGWTQHRHNDDDAYDNVILHVVMWNDTGQPTSRTRSGREAPILALDRYVAPKLDSLTETVSPEEYPHASTASAGRCQELLRRTTIDPEWIGQFLDRAGDERILRKAKLFGEMPEAASPEALLYLSLMEAAGFKTNKRPMRRLAQLVPLDRAMALIADRGVIALQAALFGMATLLPPQLELPGADPETADYLAQLRHHWAAMSMSFDAEPLDQSAWKLASTRPVNHPVRRIAGMSRLLERAAESGGLISMIERELRRTPAAPSRRIARSPAAKALVDFLTSVADPYWSWRTGFGSKRLRAQTRLIGPDRAAEMFVNAVVPLVLLFARNNTDEDLEKRLHRAYATLPPAAANSVLRFMESRVLGGEEPARTVVNSARRQQGLIQLYRDYCELDAEGCRRCAFATALEGT